MKMPSLSGVNEAPSFVLGEITVPDQYIPLFFYHNEVSTTILVLTHKRMGNEMQKRVR